MKLFLYRFINVGPVQIGSTVLWWAILFVGWRGIESIYHTPPTMKTLQIVLCIGVVFAVLGAILNIPNFDKPNEKTDKTEK